MLQNLFLLNVFVIINSTLANNIQRLFVKNWTSGSNRMPNLKTGVQCAQMYNLALKQEASVQGLRLGIVEKERFVNKHTYF